MKNFSIYFSHPLFLLLLIPAVFFTLFPYFRLNRKYRKTRNRVTSVTLHLLVMLFSVFVLSGIGFLYTEKNEKNEILLLVDVSDTQSTMQDVRDEWIRTILQDASLDDYNVGVVTFGFDQVYAVPFTNDVESVYEQYLAAELPDTGATDIASAFLYARDLFTNPETGKIVLLSDGLETDETATSVIRSVAAKGITIDVAYIPTEYGTNDVRIVSATMPEYHVSLNQQTTLQVTLYTDHADYVGVSFFDNGEEAFVTSEQLSKGMYTLSVDYAFTEAGVHELMFVISPESDSVEQNNVLYTYYSLEIYNRLLVLEREDSASDSLLEMLSSEDATAYECTTVNIFSDDVPESVNELRLYDQVILNNVSPKDMPAGFEELLERYVREYGGGMFTVGGTDENGNANAYSREISGTLYQQMLPVLSVNYKPSMGVVFIIDRSGSMKNQSKYGTYLDWAKAGAAACLNVLDERDYVGIVTLDSYNTVTLAMTPYTQRQTIENTINDISIDEVSSGQTIFADSIDRAGEMLAGLKNVTNRHIVIISDCILDNADEQFGIYGQFIASNYEKNGTTVSIAMLPNEGSSVSIMEATAELGHGELYVVSDIETLPSLMKADLTTSLIEAMKEETFQPTVATEFSYLVSSLERDEADSSKLAISLDGYYGMKSRDSAEVLLTGPSDVPIYAQWKYGTGSVGCFMCDLSGDWSAAFVASALGRTFIRSVVDNLMPMESIRPSEIRVNLKRENYVNTMSVYTELNDGEFIRGEIELLSSENGTLVSLNDVSEEAGVCYVTTCLSAANGYSRCEFVLKEGGVYRITITKYASDGTQLASYRCVNAFSYSNEYGGTTDEEVDSLAMLSVLANNGNGYVLADIENPQEVFYGFVTKIRRTYDPRSVLAILSIVLLLTDIAVRKFKFKWLHEMIGAHKDKNERT